MWDGASQPGCLAGPFAGGRIRTYNQPKAFQPLTQQRFCSALVQADRDVRFSSRQLWQDHLPLPAGSWKVKADEICKANSTRTARDWKRHEGSLTLLGAVLPSPLPTAIIPADLQIPDSYF